MLIRHFRVEECGMTGTNGLKPLWLDREVFEPTAMPAHDVLEHQPTYAGDKRDEWMALGAILFVRGTQINPHGSSAFNLAYDIVAFENSRFETEYHWQWPEPPPTRALRDEDAEETIRAIPAEYRKQFRAENSNEKGISRTSMMWLCDWMRIGYRRAQKRYGGNPGDLNWYYKFINEQAFKLDYDALGSRVVGRFDVKRRKVSFQQEGYE